MAVQTPVRLGDGDHVVQFYESEGELVTVVGAYLADAIDDGGTALAVATPAHSTGFEAVLRSRGIDVDAVRASGSLIVLDAAATLEQFAIDGGLDAIAFDRVIGGLVRSLTRDGRSLHAFGEMVALLWDAGDVESAVQLEQRWNGLREEQRLTLLCGYPASLIASGDPGGFQDVCAHHTTVVRHFDCDRRSPREARRSVATTLIGWGHDALVDDATIVATELATNSVVHAQSAFDVVVDACGNGDVRITVIDTGLERPVLRSPSAEQVSGRGIALVDGLASRWGCDRVADGKRVWAELGH